MKDLQWNYYFYLEAEGNVHTENGRDLLRELSAVCAKLRLIGSYYAKNVQP
jgi:chorismate mutase/prephenate dehydratase